MKFSMLSGKVEIVCGETLSSCTTALILLAYNKRDQSYQNSRIFACYTYFHVSCRKLGPAWWNRLKNLTDVESILIRLLLFVKFVDEYAHHAWSPCQSELKERSSTPNTKFDKVTLPSRHRPPFVRHCRA